MFGTTRVSHISIISLSLSAAALSIYRKPNFYYLSLHLIQQADKFPDYGITLPIRTFGGYCKNFICQVLIPLDLLLLVKILR